MSFLDKFLNKDKKNISKLIEKEKIYKLLKYIKNDYFDVQQYIKELLILSLKKNDDYLLKLLISKNLQFPKSVYKKSILSYAISKKCFNGIIQIIANTTSLSKNSTYGLSPFEEALKINSEFKVFKILIDKNILHNSEPKLPILHQIIDNDNIEEKKQEKIISYLLKNIPLNLDEEIQEIEPLIKKAYKKEKKLLVKTLLSYGASIKPIYKYYTKIFNEYEVNRNSSLLLKNQKKENYEYFLPFLNYKDFKTYLNSLVSTKNMQILILMCENILISNKEKIELTEIALDKGCDINEFSKDTHKVNVLQYYCKNYIIKDDFSFINYLIHNGALFNFNNNSPLVACISNRQIPLLKYLVKEKGININELDKEGCGAINGFFDPIHFNNNEEKIQMLEALLELGLDINQKVMGSDTDEYPTTSIIKLLLFEKNNHNFLEYILKNYDELKVENEISLIFKYQVNDELCKLLIAKNPNYCDNSYYSKEIDEKIYYYSAQALDMAIDWERFELANYLIDKYPNMKTYTEHDSLIHIAYSIGFSIDFVEKLIKRDPNLNRLYYIKRNFPNGGECTQKETTLRRVLYDIENDPKKTKKLVKLLLEYNADANIPSYRIGSSNYAIQEEHCLLSIIEDEIDEEFLDMFIKKGKIDLNEIRTNKNEPLGLSLLSIRSNSDESILKYLKYFNKKSSFDLEYKNLEGDNYLLKAASNCLPKCVEYFIELGSNIHEIGGFDNSPAIHKAISNYPYLDKQKRAQTVEVLAKAGADLKQLDSEELTALMSASKYGCFECIIKLLENGADANDKNTTGENSANVLIPQDFESKNYSYDDKDNFEENKSKILAVLKDYGCDLDNVPQENSTILCNAIGFNLKTIFNTLLQLEIDINKKDKDGLTAIMVAVNFADVYFINTLLQNPNIDLLCESNTGENLIHKAIRRENDENVLDLIKYFIQNNVPIKLLENGMNLLIFASFYCHYKLYEGLLKYVEDINAKDNYGLNALFWSIKSNYNVSEKDRVFSIDKLIQLDANVKQLDSSGKNLLHYAVLYHCKLTFETLFEKYNLDINQKDFDGNSPICYFVTNYFNNVYENCEDFFENYITKVVKYGANLEEAINFAKSIDENSDIIKYLEGLK